ncbi:nose resistant to fluoxetine protein 6-like [Haemaphysalis longicornis]
MAGQGRLVRFLFLATVCLLLCFGVIPRCVRASASTRSNNSSSPTADTGTGLSREPPASPTMMDSARRMLGQLFQSADNSPLLRKMMHAEVSPGCTIGLLRFTRAIRNLEPWAVRLIDASGKYPTGLFQGSWADLGAFDECVETVALDQNGGEKARGQYCNVYMKVANDTSFLDEMLPAFLMAHERFPELLAAQQDRRVPGMRLGICTIADCTLDDIQALADTLTQGVAKIVVKDCTTNEPKQITKAQLAIIASLVLVVVMMIASSAIDVWGYRRGEKPPQESKARRLLTAFSVPGNTRFLLSVNENRESDAHKYRFLHGLRFFSILWIVLGHTSMALDQVIGRYANVLHATSSWFFCIISTAYLSVDTFFFLSGFFLAYNILKVKKNSFLVGVIAVLRRIIRVTVPVFFVLMCFCLLPLLVAGPNTNVFFEKFYGEMARHWWTLLLQMRNFGADTGELECFAHLWYLSTDFQLFLVAVVVLMVFKRHTQWMQWSFGILSLACCAFSAWQMSSGRYVPVIPLIVADISILQDTFNDVYVLPTFHGAAFFLGCSTLIFMETHKEVNMSTLRKAVMWLVCVVCGAVCILSRHQWNGGFSSTGGWVDVVFTFFDRLLWSAFLGCLVFGCAHRQAGIVGRFLSWRAFVPLSRLSFGVYLVHMPYFIASFALTRERVHYSIMAVVSSTVTIFVWSCFISFALFLMCESPTGIIEKTLLMPSRISHDSADQQKDGGPKVRRPVITYICPRLVVTQDQTTQASAVHHDQCCRM